MVVYESALRLCCLLVGCLYPAFASFKILNGKRRSETDQRVWLAYWIVYGIYVVFDFLTASLVAFVPFLREFKLLFLCWLLPSMGAGCQLIYNEFLCSFLAQNENSIDQAFDNASKTGSHIFGHVLNTLYGQLMSVAEHCLLVRRSSNNLRLTPSVQLVINQMLAMRQVKQHQEETGVMPDDQPSSVNEAENKMEVIYKEYSANPITPERTDKPTPPPCPPKPKRQQVNATASKSEGQLLSLIIHEQNEHQVGNQADTKADSLLSESTLDLTRL